jgi:hypothetical protein
MSSITPCGYSIQEFRALHGYGEKAYKALKKAGLAPRETLIPGTIFARITPDDYAAWLKHVSQPECQLKEFLRRREMFAAHGRKASQSPTHPAQVWATFKKLKLTKEPAPPPKRPGGRPRKMQAVG